MTESEIYRAFGRAIAQRRGSSRMSQEDVAKIVGLSRASIANIEAGRQKVYLHQILSLAEALKLGSAHELVPGFAGASVATEQNAPPAIEGRELTKTQRALINRVYAKAPMPKAYG